MGWVYVISFQAVLGLFPAAIASRKGRSFVRWWLFGAVFFVVALPMAAFARPQEALEWREVHTSSPPSATRLAGDVLQALVMALVLSLALMAFFGAVMLATTSPGDYTSMYKGSRAQLWDFATRAILLAPPILWVAGFVLIQVMRQRGRELRAFRVTSIW